MTQQNLLGLHLKMIAKDERLLPTHLSLYIAILICWQEQNFSSEVIITRRELMALAKFAGRPTYHRCLQKLIALGYVSYTPTYDTYKKSRIRLFEFSVVQPPDGLNPKKEEGSKPKI